MVVFGIGTGFLLACTGMGTTPEPEPPPPVPVPPPTPVNAPIRLNGTSYDSADGWQCCKRTRDGEAPIGRESGVFTIDKDCSPSKPDDKLGSGSMTDWNSCVAYFDENVCCVDAAANTLKDARRSDCSNLALEPACDRYKIVDGKIAWASEEPRPRQPRTGNGGPVQGIPPEGKTGKGKAGKNR
jgi:hypothetical protein